MKTKLQQLLLIAGLMFPVALPADVTPAGPPDPGSSSATQSRDSRPRPGRFLSRLAEKLSLTPEQKSAIAPVVRSWREKVAALEERSALERRQLFQRAMDEIRGKLDEKQQAILDEELREARRRLRSRRDR